MLKTTRYDLRLKFVQISIAMNSFCQMPKVLQRSVMLNAAFIILAIAVLLGIGLALAHMRAGPAMPPWPIGVLHGLLALAGVGCLAFALNGPPRGLDQGTASFGTISAALFVLAGLFGGGLLSARRRGQRLGTTLIGLHAMLAISGFVIFATYVLAG